MFGFRSFTPHFEEALLVSGDLLLEKGIINIRKTHPTRRARSVRATRIATATIETAYSNFPEQRGDIWEREIYPEDDQNVIERKFISLVQRMLQEEEIAEESSKYTNYWNRKRMPESAKDIAKKYLSNKTLSWISSA